MAGHVDVGGGGSCKVEYTMDTRRKGESKTFQARYEEKKKNVRVRVRCDGKDLYPWQPLKKRCQVVVEWK